MLSGADDVNCGVGECWILWEWTLFWYVRVHMNKNTFYIDSYLLDRSELVYALECLYV